MDTPKPPLPVPVVPLRRGGAAVIGRSALGAARHRVQRDLVRHLGGAAPRLPAVRPAPLTSQAPPADGGMEEAPVGRGPLY